MSADSRRARGLLATVVAHPLLKVTAIALAAMLWWFVDNRITRTLRRTIPLTTVGAQSVIGEQLERLAVVLPTDRVVGRRFFDGTKPIDRVEVVLSGPRFRVSAVEDNQILDLQVTKFLSLDWSTRTDIEFDAGDIRRDRALEQLRIELVPPRVRLEVELVEERKFTLSIDQVELQEGPFADRLRRETVKFAPDTAVVLGPAYAIEDLARRGGKPFRAVLKGGSAGQVSASLELVRGGEAGLRFAAVPVLTMDVLPETKAFTLELPVMVDDLALPPELRGLYKPDPETRSVAIRAGGPLHAALAGLADSGGTGDTRRWAMNNLRLLVIVRREKDETLPAEIEREARLLFVGKTYQSVDHYECLLQDPVLVKLRRP